MNINIFCSLRSTKSSDLTCKIDIDKNNTIISRINGPSFRFNKIFKDVDDINKVHQSILNALVTGVINGFNTSLMLFGETGSGKSYILAGNDNNRSGMFTATLKDIFTRLDTDERFRSSYKIRLRMFEVHNDVLVDLLHSNNSSKFSADSVLFSAGQGYEIRDMTEVEIMSAAQAVVLFRDSWSRRIMYGKNDPDVQAAAIVQIKLFLKNFEEDAKDTVSQMSFVYLPGDECLIQSSSDISGEKKRNGIFAVGKLLGELNDPSSVYASYSECLLTTLLEDELCGNCITHALLCLPSRPNPDILAAQLRTMNHLDKVKTCPIMNTENARNLLYGLRLQRKELLHSLIKDLKHDQIYSPLNQYATLEKLKITQRENAELRDKVETLQQRLEKMHSRYSHAMMDKSNISDDFIQSEEEKLRASKKIMDLEIENSKSKERMETVRFELSNKILHLEEKLVNLEMERITLIRDAKAFTVVSEENKKLNKMYSSLQKSFDDLKNEAGLIVSKNKELNLEYLNMLKVKRKVSKNELEVDRIIPLADVYHVDHEKDVFSLSQNRRPISEISEQGDRTVKLRLGKLQEELQKTRQTAHDRLKQVSMASVDLVVLREENQQLQMRIKDIRMSLESVTQEFQYRIRKYATNVSSILDISTTNEKKYKDEITSLLKRYDSSHIVNENYSKNLLKDARKQFDNLRNWSERLVYEYVKLRQKILDEGINNVDIGPDPSEIVHDYSLPNDYLKMFLVPNDSRPGLNVMELKHQLKEFSNATQTNLEIERAQLLARNADLEEQLISAQNYIDIYIKEKSVRQKK